MVNDVLDLAKIEAGKHDLDLEPVAMAEAVEQAVVLRHEQGRRGDGLHGQAPGRLMARVLVVEDDPRSQTLVRDVLVLDGHEVLVAGDVAEARVALATWLDLVLLDIHIPGGGGERLLREIRAAGANMPVALTASAMSGDRERFLDAGFTVYLSKPIDVRTFCRHIEELLRRA